MCVCVCQLITVMWFNRNNVISSRITSSGQVYFMCFFLCHYTFTTLIGDVFIMTSFDQTRLQMTLQL